MNLIDLSASLQDYLETIYELEKKLDRVRITDIAKKMENSKASVNQTVKKLKSYGLAEHKSYGPVQLTDEGRRIAVSVRNRHDIIKKFLIEILGVENDIAEEDACMMEHVVSTHTIDKLTKYISGIIPGSYEKEKKDSKENKLIELNRLKTGQRAEVKKILAKGNLKRKMLEMGITTGTEIKVKGFAPLGDPMEITLKGYCLSMRKKEAAEILVELL